MKKKGREKVRWKRDSIALCIAHPCYTRAARMRAHVHIDARAHWQYHFTDDIPYREFIALEVQRRTTKIRSRMLKREKAT